MELTFDLRKAAQAAATILRARPGQRMSYLRLLKLLYLADRQMFASKLRTITGDQPVAMKKGPVLERLYHLLKEEGPDPGESKEWSAYFRRDGHEVVLEADPGTGELSRLEKNTLLDLLNQYHRTDDWELVELTHALPEWQSSYREGEETTRIPWEEVLRVCGKDHLIEAAQRDERARRLFDVVFGKG